jgi:hypothetical protein
MDGYALDFAFNVRTLILHCYSACRVAFYSVYRHVSLASLRVRWLPSASFCCPPASLASKGEVSVAMSFFVRCLFVVCLLLLLVFVCCCWFLIAVVAGGHFSAFHF